MNAITTLEELNALDVGTLVNVRASGGRQQVWEKTDGQLRMNGTTLNTDYFLGAINEGAVSIGPLFTVGTWHGQGADKYYIKAVAEDGSATVLHVYSDFSACDENWTTLLAPACSAPEYDYLVRHLVEECIREKRRTMTITARRDALLEQRTEWSNQVQEYRERLNTALNGVIDEFDDDDDKNKLARVMRAHDMEHSHNIAHMRITVRGVAEVSMGAEEAERLLPGSVTIVGTGVCDVDWEYVIDVTDVEYEGGESDPCEDYDTFDDDWIRDQLDNADIQHDGNDGDIEIMRRQCTGCNLSE